MGSSWTVVAGMVWRRPTTRGRGGRPGRAFGVWRAFEDWSGDAMRRSRAVRGGSCGLWRSGWAEGRRWADRAVAGAAAGVRSPCVRRGEVPRLRVWVAVTGSWSRFQRVPESKVRSLKKSIALFPFTPWSVRSHDRSARGLDCQVEFPKVRPRKPGRGFVRLSNLSRTVLCCLLSTKKGGMGRGSFEGLLHGCPRRVGIDSFVKCSKKRVCGLEGVGRDRLQRLACAAGGRIEYGCHTGVAVQYCRRGTGEVEALEMQVFTVAW